MCKVKKVVLTGGPCAGKTTALAKIHKEFTELGYQVFIVSEGATEVIRSGAKPFGEIKVPNYIFEKELLQYQLYRENMYERMIATLPENTKCLMICDRGTMDVQAYLDSNEFLNLLSELHYNELDLLERYELVLHLVTAANGAEEYYTLENNSSRTETIEQARIMDQKTLESWVGHSNLKVVGNDGDFSDKMNSVLRYMHSLLDEPIPIQNQRKFLVQYDSLEEMISKLPSYKKVRIEQFYTDEIIEHCFRKVYDGMSYQYYEITKKYPYPLNQSNRIKTMALIDEIKYHQYLEMQNILPIVKDRYSFVYDNQYFRLDIFDDCCENLCLLEIEGTLDNEKIEIPPFLKVVDEVSENPLYRNASLHSFLNKKTYKKLVKS